MSSPNLWGELPPVKEQLTPRQILKEQAAILGQSTRNQLEGAVYMLDSTSPENVECDLEIRVPLLGNYRYDVLRLQYSPLQFYPALVTDLAENSTALAANEQELFEQIKRILRSDRVRNAIAALLMQVSSEDPDIKIERDYGSGEIPF